jgi:integrase
VGYFDHQTCIPSEQPNVIQAILRHSDIGTTLAYYVQTSNEESREVLQIIESAFPFGL